MSIDRRTFLTATGFAAAAPTLAATPASRRRGEPFQMLYAPHFGMFGNHAVELDDQLQFAADEGFRAWEDNGMPGRDPATQERLGKKMAALGMTMGVFVAHGDFSKPTFASGQKDHADRVLADIAAAVEVGKRVNARWCTVVPGSFDRRQDADFQTANVVELLKRCCDVLERAKSDLVMVLEPLNFRDHPNLFLTRIGQAFGICRAVGSPHCKILDDLYHQQVSEGNLIPNLDRGWSEIAYFQVGDNPGRNEPGTGEVHFRNIFRHLHGKGYRGVVGMEHGNAEGGKDGERKLIERYRDADRW